MMTALLAAGAVWLGVAADTHATLTWTTPLTLNSPGVVGTSIGVTGSGQGSYTFEQVVAQHLLDMGANSTEPG